MADLKTVLTSTAVSIAAIVAAIGMGFGKNQIVYKTDGSEVNIAEAIDALDNKIEASNAVLADAIKKGTKELRIDALQSINREYKAKIAEMKARMRQEQAERNAKRRNPRELLTHLQESHS